MQLSFESSVVYDIPVYIILYQYSNMLASKVSSKYQATIPSNVREFLHLKKGDKVAFQIKRDQVVIKRVTSSDEEYLNSMSSNTLSEWASTEDDRTYENL